MNDRLPPVSHDQIPTLLDRQREGEFVVAFCPVCDRTAAADTAGCDSETAASQAIAKIQLHIRKTHRPKPQRVKITLSARRSTAANRVVAD